MTATTQDSSLFVYSTSLKTDGNRTCSWKNVSKAEKKFFYQLLDKSRNRALGPGSHMIQQMLFPASASFHSEATASMFNSASRITYKIMLACINERPDLELQQKHRTQLLFGRTKKQHPIAVFSSHLTGLVLVGSWWFNMWSTKKHLTPLNSPNLTYSYCNPNVLMKPRWDLSEQFARSVYESVQFACSVYDVYTNLCTLNAMCMNLCSLHVMCMKCVQICALRMQCASIFALCM